MKEKKGSDSTLYNAKSHTIYLHNYIVYEHKKNMSKTNNEQVKHLRLQIFLSPSVAGHCTKAHNT